VAAPGCCPASDPADGAIYTTRGAPAVPGAASAWSIDRYLRRYHGRSAPGEPLPIGTPTSSRNERVHRRLSRMFFRNPHYFAVAEPRALRGLYALFRQDPRQAWAADFPFYVEENRTFYLSGQQPWPAG